MKKNISKIIKKIKKMFISENEMQTWLSNGFKNDITIGELILNQDTFEAKIPTNIEEKKIKESFEYCLSSLHLTNVISENENISLKDGDSLKPDFLLYAPETESFVIVELKNIDGPTRQAGTEIHAYSTEIKSYIPFISDGDIVNVIISPTWPTLLRHYIFHEIFWLQRNIICLEPLDDNGDKKLVIKDISIFTEGNVSLKLGDKHLGGYQICLYGSSSMALNIEQMKTSVWAMASKGNSQKNHGFAFLWKDLWTESMAPYSITIVNFAAFNSLERFYHNEDFEPNKITEKIIDDVIKEYCPEGHGKSLETITKYGDKFLKSFCSPRIEGFHTWDVLKDVMLGRCELISFHSWGIFEELYSDKLSQEYAKGNLYVGSSDPQLGLDTINYLIDPNYEFMDLSYLNYDPDEDDSEE